MDGDSEIPPLFICPISLQIMKDPVTLTTGISYDRDSIDRWLSKYNHNTCPVTKQRLRDRSLTPNTTLLRVIQSWRIENSLKINASSAVESPRPLAFDVAAFRKLVDEVREPRSQIKALRKIRSLIRENDEDCTRYMELESAGLVSLMASLITKRDPSEISYPGDGLTAIEEAVSVLYLLKESSPDALKKVSEDQNGKFIQALSMVMQKGSSCHARIHASLLLKSIFKVVHDMYKTGLKPELFDGLVEILKDHNSNQATEAALSILIEVTQFENNAAVAVKAGLVAVLVELLVEIDERQRCEAMLRLLGIVCGRSTEGREAFVAHPMSVAAVSTKIMKVSEEADEGAVKLLLMACKSCGKKTGGVVKEMEEVGGAAKVCMVLQAGMGGRKVKDMAQEIMRIHLKTSNKFNDLWFKKY